jgi:hypothetical protein
VDAADAPPSLVMSVALVVVTRSAATGPVVLMAPLPLLPCASLLRPLLLLMAAAAPGRGAPAGAAPATAAPAGWEAASARSAPTDEGAAARGAILILAT